MSSAGSPSFLCACPPCEPAGDTLSRLLSNITFLRYAKSSVIFLIGKVYIFLVSPSGGRRKKASSCLIVGGHHLSGRCGLRQRRDLRRCRQRQHRGPALALNDRIWPLVGVVTADTGRRVSKLLKVHYRSCSLHLGHILLSRSGPTSVVYVAVSPLFCNEYARGLSHAAHARL